MNPFINNANMTQLFVAASVSMLIYYNSVKRFYHLSRSGILQPNRSPWRHLYDIGDEGSFLNLTGFSQVAFEEMLEYLYDDVQAQQTMVCLLYVFAPAYLPCLFGGSSYTLSFLPSLPMIIDLTANDC